MITSTLWLTVGLMFIVAGGSSGRDNKWLSRNWFVDMVAGGILCALGSFFLSLAIKVTP